MRLKIKSFFQISLHKDTHTCIHIYIYIYIYTHECTLLYHKTMIELYTWWFMHEQYVKGVQNEQNYLISIWNITMWLYQSLAGPETRSLLFKEQRKTQCQEWVSGVFIWHSTISTGQSCSLREIIIYCPYKKPVTRSLAHSVIIRKGLFDKSE